ncbi:MAG: DUF2752 domain-containing protein, partial [Gemmataceae bacterium]
DAFIPYAVPALGPWVRGTLVGIALGLSAVFGIAWWLNPYQPSGEARRMETHRQLGLPPCTFKVLSGLPCPSCGMTTSFSLLIRGDLWNSLRANGVGTLLGLFCLAAIPWCLLSAVRGQPLFLVSLELVLMRMVFAFLILMILRWVVVVAALWYTGAVRPGG